MIDGEMTVFALVVSALVVLLPAAAGLAMIIGGLRHWNRVRRLTGTGEHAVATVVDNQVQSGSKGSLSFRPVVTFTTLTGREVRTVLTEQISFRSHLTGTQQTVAFDPEQPDRAVATTGQTGGAARALVFGSIFLLFAGFALYLVSSMLLPNGNPFGGMP
ncbi:DUF3592 domain-containing protein [Actinoplanes sp. NPDC020271]|uniref:DUF3592 domain-containing protein n=1 Tax=Actinoplanes sp. NPDC020271 TaxID=3363896 RepID=UPI0037A12E64